MRTVSGLRNRTLLLLLGLLLLVGGILLGLVATAAAATVPWMNQWAPSPSTSLGSLLEPANQYLLAIGIAVTVIAGLFALWWLAHQIPAKDRTSPYRLADDDDHGTVTVAPGVLAQAVEDQLEALPGVSRAHAELAGSARHPELVATITLAPHTSVEWLLGQVYGTVIADLETSLETRLEHVGLALDATRDSASSSKTSVRGTTGRTTTEQHSPHAP